jgi:hypothetical protein
MPEKFLGCIPLTCFYHLVGVVAALSTLYALILTLEDNFFEIAPLLANFVIFVLYICSLMSLMGNPESRLKSLRGLAITFLICNIISGLVAFIAGCVVVAAGVASVGIVAIVLGVIWIVWGVYGYFCLKSFLVEQELKMQAI